MLHAAGQVQHAVRRARKDHADAFDDRAPERGTIGYRPSVELRVAAEAQFVHERGELRGLVGEGRLPGGRRPVCGRAVMKNRRETGPLGLEGTARTAANLLDVLLPGSVLGCRPVG